ncbi:MAG: sugar-transfer associated ATP-grasp domain-containing protein [Rhizomicrobium sp.]
MTAGALRLDPNCVDMPKPERARTSASRLSRVAADGKRSYFAMLSEIVRLGLGSGRLSLDEYLELELFDNDIHKDTDKKAYVGSKGHRKIWFQANYRVDLFALANNKIASAILFAAHGLPILPTLAIFHEQVGRPNARLLGSDGELRAFLRTSEHYPLFGKPIEGNQSIGSASIKSYDAARDCLMTTTGRIIGLENFISYVKTHASSGYQFQARISPHATVREMCGDRLATVRVLTIVTNGKPEILRACWKIPAGMHTADNFWRPGNLLAQLDLESGRVMRVIRASGTAFEEITHHPDSGMLITGTFVPNWQEVKRLAIDCAKVLEALPLVGWDIAPVDSGVILVEANVTPDMRLHQMADRRGILDPALKDFLRQRKKDAAEVRRAAKRNAVRDKLALLEICWREAIRALMWLCFGAPSGNR